jgi:hypothetical protein
MKKGIIISIFCIFFLINSSIPVIGIDITEKEINKNYLIEKFFNKNQEIFFGNYFIYTMGPVSKLFTKVELLYGNEYQIDKIDKNINRKFPRISMFLPYIFVTVDDLDFNYEYLIDVKNGSRFSYGTTWGEAVYNNSNLINITNESLTINRIHKIQVINFTGIFLFMRMRVRKIPFLPNTNNWLIPARFAFIGCCEDIQKINS